MIELVGARIRTDVGVDQEGFAFLNARVAVDQICLAVAQRLHFAADQDQAGFVGFVDRVIMPCLAVDADNLLAGCGGFLICHVCSCRPA